MSSLPIVPPRSRSWFRPQFSLGTLMWLMVVVGMGIGWWKDRRSFDQRLQKLEEMYNPPARSLWGAADILGAPDDPTGIAGKSWCPAGSSGADWVEVAFDRARATTTINLYETYSVGCVTEVLVVDRYGRETSIWQGTGPTSPTARSGLFRVPVPKSIKSVQRVKIHVDSTGKSSWACLDAVGLTTGAGRTTWATSPACSSVYGGGGLTASSKNGIWQSLW